MTKLAEQIGAEEDYDDDYYGPLQYGTGAEQRKPVMTLAIAKRPPEAVKELEAMQQKERAGAGEQVLSTEDFERLLRADIEGELISNRLKNGGLEAAIKAAGSDEALVEETYRARLNAWRVDDPSQWSRYEPAATRSQIADICSRIESVFAKHKWALKEVPVVGTLTTGQVSAGTQRSSAGSPMVLIDNGFFRFSGIMSQLAVFARYDAKFRGGFHEATVQLVSDLAATQTVLNTCLYAYLRPTPPGFETNVADLQDAISLFVISHEYAHISAGDFDAHPLTRQQDETLRRTKEFEADKVGFITVVEAAHDAEPGLFAPFLFFAGLDLLTQAAAAYKGQSAPPATSSAADYPTPYERTVSLLAWLKTTSYATRFGEQLGEASAWYNIILSVWDLVLTPFSAARDQMSQFDPALHGQSHYPDADVNGVVSTLWQYVSAHLRQA